MKELEELTREIREKLPRLVEKYTDKYWCEVTELKAPMLNDVLQWFKESDMKDGINMMHELVWSHTVKEIINRWELSTPHLRDQSPELIKFLHSLIKTKQ